MGVKVVRATADIPHHFQSQMVKDRGHQAAVCGCSSHYLQGGGDSVAAALQAAQFYYTKFQCQLNSFYGRLNYEAHGRCMREH